VTLGQLQQRTAVGIGDPKSPVVHTTPLVTIRASHEPRPTTVNVACRPRFPKNLLLAVSNVIRGRVGYPKAPTKGKPMLRFASVLGLVLAGTVCVEAQWLNHRDPNIPRTADGMPNLAAPPPQFNGKPDLSGV
jgi:hypothetical protein